MVPIGTQQSIFWLFSKSETRKGVIISNRIWYTYIRVAIGAIKRQQNPLEFFSFRYRSSRTSQPSSRSDTGKKESYLTGSSLPGQTDRVQGIFTLLGFITLFITLFITSLRNLPGQSPGRGPHPARSVTWAWVHAIFLILALLNFLRVYRVSYIECQVKSKLVVSVFIDWQNS
jgi:hypothetical protein